MSEANQDAPQGRFNPNNPNMVIWAAAERTDRFVSLDSNKEAVKAYNKKGFSGSAINATYIIKRLTDAFGPCGLGWGTEIVEEDYRQGAPIFSEDKKTVLAHHIVHTLRICLWYKHPSFPGEIGRVYQFGQTDFVSTDRRGIVTDEEAPKKSLTDAMTKAASWLGIASDVHLGMWDDNKYTSQVAEFAEQERNAIQRQLMLAKPYCFINSAGEVFTEASAEKWIAGWEKRIKAWAIADRATIGMAWRANSDAVETTRKADPDAVAQVEAFIRVAEAPTVPDAPPPAAEPPVQASGDAPPPGAEAAPPPPANDDPPVEVPMIWVDAARTLHKVKANDKGVPVQDLWLASWRRGLDSIKTLPRLEEWSKENKQGLELLERYWPPAFELAKTAYVSRREALRASAAKEA